MRVYTWNVNSIRARLPHLVDWLGRTSPDVVCVQETKVTDDLFPAEALADAGYRAVFTGQKTYNGVATLARMQLSVDDVERSLDGDASDEHRRFVACTVEGVRVINVYVPNGQAVGAPAFSYKLAWLDRLARLLEGRHAPSEPLLVCGDFNIAPAPLDVHDPKRWEGKVLFHPREREAFDRLVGWGLVDTFRALHPDAAEYSWWDMRTGAYRRNDGLRIDHVLATRPLAERASRAWIERTVHDAERPSDHVPVGLEVDDLA
jgi:exodeoxyribonuclease-3